MPGLVAIVASDPREPVDAAVFQRMSAAVKHREWYGVDTYVGDDGRIAISPTHLRTILPQTQPFTSADGSVKIFLHGEIYNDEADPANQLEFVLRTYERFGTRFAARLNGSFVAIVVDEKRDRVIVANDRTASRPVFYFADAGAFYMAPELKALLGVPSLVKRLNLCALAAFLSAGHLLDGETFLDGVRLLGNATVVTISRGRVELTKYWQYRFDEAGADLGAAHYRETLTELIRKAVRRRIRTNHRYGLMLSGGYDSRGILGCYLEEREAEGTQTITWGRSEDVPLSDAHVAGRLARRLGTRHTFYALEPAALPHHLADFIHLSDGLTDGGMNYPESLKIFARVREDLGAQILLRGDECFGYTEFWELHALRDMPSARALLRPKAYKALAESSAALLLRIVGPCTLREPQNRRDVFYLEQRLTQYLHPLTWVKAVEIEVRNPYLDDDILDFLSSSPAKYRIERRLYRSALVKAFPRLYGEFAQLTDDIDWEDELEHSAALRGYARRLLDESALVRRLIDPVALEEITDAAGPPPRRLKALAIRAVGRHATLYGALKLYYKKLTYRSASTDVARHVLLFRLLTLALWERTFLPDAHLAVPA
jgi:asparagine synthetase B (glutamine-hydrolysing)